MQTTQHAYLSRLDHLRFFAAALVVLSFWRSKFNVLAVLPGAAAAGGLLFSG